MSQYPVSDKCCRHCGRLPLNGDVVIDNDEKEASSKFHTQFKTRSAKTISYYFLTKKVKIDTLFMIKMAEKSYLLKPHILVPIIIAYKLYLARSHPQITAKLSEAYPSRFNKCTDYLKLEPASPFYNAIMN